MKMALQSPSFSLSSPSHSSRSLEQIAARVINEFLNEEDSKQEGNFFFEEEEEFVIDEKKEEEDEDEKEFEFPLIAKNWISFPSPADENFYTGGILPVYPVFNTNLLLDAEVIMDEETPPPVVDPEPDKAIRMPLKMLFKEDREISSSNSSSEVDELDGISPGTYCVWNPNNKVTASAAGEEVVVGEKRWRKSSSSTGVSRRWKLKDLIHRSSSDGSKGRFVFLTPSNSQGKRMEEMRKF